MAVVLVVNIVFGLIEARHCQPNGETICLGVTVLAVR